MVGDFVNRSKAAGLPWSLPEEMNDDALEWRLFPDTSTVLSNDSKPDDDAVKEERARKDVTLQLLKRGYR
jgi:hypothetical protein